MSRRNRRQDRRRQKRTFGNYSRLNRLEALEDRRLLAAVGSFEKLSGGAGAQVGAVAVAGETELAFSPLIADEQLAAASAAALSRLC